MLLFKSVSPLQSRINTENSWSSVSVQKSFIPWYCSVIRLNILCSFELVFSLYPCPSWLTPVLEPTQSYSYPYLCSHITLSISTTALSQFSVITHLQDHPSTAPSYLHACLFGWCTIGPNKWLSNERTSESPCMVSYPLPVKFLSIKSNSHQL